MRQHSKVTLPHGWHLSAFADEISENLDESLRELSRAGIQLFDLRTALRRNVSELTEADLKQIQFEMRVFGMRVYSVASPVNKRPYNPADWHLENAKLKRCCAVASDLGAQCVRIFSPFQGEQGPSLEQCLEVLEHQISIAAEYETYLIHENDGTGFGAYPENAKLLFRYLKAHPYRFRMVFDFANAVNLGFPAIPHWFPWLTYIPLDSLHVKDAKTGAGEAVPAGEGDGQILEVLRLLIKAGWTGTLSLEPHMGGGIESFRRALDGLNRVLSEL